MDTDRLTSWIEIAADAYRANLAFFRRLVGPEVELAAVVKANAYGHGWRIIAELAAQCGADSFCVHSLDEALQLRAAGIRCDVLIMGPVPLARLGEVVAQDFRLVVFNRETAERLSAITDRQGRTVRVHLKLETGTYRQGIGAEELGWFLDYLPRHPRLRVEGVATHFANIEDTTDHRYARSQLACFEELVARLRGAGIGPGKRHTACSAAILIFPRTHFEMVRLGIAQYGLWPSKETCLSYKLLHPEEGEEALRPVLTWKTRVSQLQWVPAGRFIGYGCTYQTTRSTRIAVLPVGYADGYDRDLSNRAHVLVRGRRAPVRGRVCMNLTMVDTTDVPDVELEDEVVLLGRQGAQEITAEYLASLTGTISYEIVTRINGDLPRIAVASKPALRV